jgi:hypothetical protein
MPAADRKCTHNPQRTAFATLLEDIHAHFQTLRQHPALGLQEIGSPFADQMSAAPPLLYAV